MCTVVSYEQPFLGKSLYICWDVFNYIIKCYGIIKKRRYIKKIIHTLGIQFFYLLLITPLYVRFSCDWFFISYALLNPDFRNSNTYYILLLYTHYNRYIVFIIQSAVPRYTTAAVTIIIILSFQACFNNCYLRDTSRLYGDYRGGFDISTL